MSRFMVIAFMVITFSFGLNFFNEVNLCYCGPNCYSVGKVCILSNPNVGYNTQYTGHRIIDAEITPMIDSGRFIKDGAGNNIDTHNETAMNMTLANLNSYQTPAASVNDFLGFFGFIMPAARFAINTFMLPLFGLPSFLITYLYVPSFLGYIIGIFIFVSMMLGIIEFLIGRSLL